MSDIDQRKGTASSGLEISDLGKAFAGNQVLRGVTVTFAPGEVHAVLGPNGAGKSTLLGCVSGAVQPDSGEFRIGGRTYSRFTPASARDAGTSIIYQHFQLVDDLTIADSIFLGDELRRADGRIDARAQLRRAGALLESLGSSLNPGTLVRRLSVGERQLVEIARALRNEPSLLILDEPTAALSDKEVQALLDLVRTLAHERGLAVVFVSHILREVKAIADKVTVLRDGRLLWTKASEELELSDLVEAISPNKVEVVAERRARRSGAKQLLRVERLVGSFTGPVDLTLDAGEVVGVFGLLGSGRTDLLETLTGVRSPRHGRVSLDGRPVVLRSPGAAHRAGLALVASDRKAQSVFPGMSNRENLLVPHYGLRFRGRRRPGSESRAFAEVAAKVGLVPADPALATDALSGGNAQKLMVGRWATGLAPVSVLVLDEPTQGVDVGSRTELYELIRSFASADSRAVLFASSDPEEVVALADTAIVLVAGRISAVLSAGRFDELDLLHHAHSSPGAITPESYPEGHAS